MGLGELGSGRGGWGSGLEELDKGGLGSEKLGSGR